MTFYYTLVVILINVWFNLHQLHQVNYFGCLKLWTKLKQVIENKYWIHIFISTSRSQQIFPVLPTQVISKCERLWFPFILEHMNVQPAKHISVRIYGFILVHNIDFLCEVSKLCCIHLMENWILFLLDSINFWYCATV